MGNKKMGKSILFICTLVILIINQKCFFDKDKEEEKEIIYFDGNIKDEAANSIVEKKAEEIQNFDIENIDKQLIKKEKKLNKIAKNKTVISLKETDESDEEEKKLEENSDNNGLDFNFIEESELIFSQGYDFEEKDDQLKKGYILASIDPIGVKPKLDILGGTSILVNNKIFFFIYSNYLSYIDKGKIILYADKQGREKLRIIDIENVHINEKYEIDLDRKNILKTVYYKLEVEDKKGNKDETDIKELNLNIRGNENTTEEEIKEKIYDSSSLKKHKIPVDFFKIRFYGKGFGEKQRLMLDDNEILTDDSGTFVYENYYFAGNHKFNFEVYEMLENEEKENSKDDEEILEKKYLYSYPMEVKIDKNYHFLVGIADIKYGKNRVEKNSELLLKNEEYDAGMFNEGRLAFYTRNRIGKYSVVAQMDTENQELKHIFDGMGKRDNREIFKDMKREDKGYTFGDDSYSMMDVDTQGQFYVRVEWDKNKALWGNYSSAIDNGEYLNYSKTLYGAQFIGASEDVTSYNEDKYSGTLFFSNPETLSEYNIFLATGGSLYYLKNRDLVEGSEEVTIEVINHKTGQKIKEVSLSEGEDYVINNIQGRIILNKPLFQYGYKEIGDIIKDNPVTDYKTYLKVQYEYYERNGIYTSDYTTGGSGKYWINDNVQIGGAYVKSTELEENYELKGINGVLRKTENTYLEWEFAQSKGKKIGRGAYSSTGGLNFSDINYIEKDEENEERLDNTGNAYKIKGVVSLNELSDKLTKGSMAEFWFDKKDGGFSVDSLDDGSTDTEYGFKSDYIVNDKLFVTTEYSKTESKDLDKKDINQEVSIQGTYRATDKMSVAVAVRHSDNKDGDTDENSSNHSDSSGGHFTDKGYESDEEGKSIDLGVTVNYQFTENTSGYVGVQKALDTTKLNANDIMGTIGGSTKLFDKLTLSGDYSVGNEESAGMIQTAYSVMDSYEVYLNVEQERMYDGNSNDVSFGQKVLIGDKYEVFQENQISKGTESSEEITQVYGLNINLTKDLRVGLGYEQGDLKEEEGKTKRNSVSTNLYYDNRKTIKYNNRLEMIRDKGAEDYTIEWLTVNDIKYRYNEEWTAVGKLDFSITEDKINGGYDKKFLEFGIGGAYRPIWNDRLNMLWKYTYLYDLTGVDKDTDYSFGDLDERSNIFSLDAIYSVTKKLDIGGKWAYKKAEMKAANDESEWFNAETTLYAINLSYNFYEKWRIFGEYHWLISDLDNEKREGVIAGIDYDVNNNLRVGLGYNFTDFSDDLRYDDYKAEGIYINIIGKF